MALQRLKTWRALIEVVLATIAAALVLKMFVVDAVRVQTSSMAETILPGDLILVNKLSYGMAAKHLPFSQSDFSFPVLPRLKKVTRGDIIVFQLAGDRDSTALPKSVPYVKRCVAVGGDVVLVRHGILFVNGEQLALYPEHEAPRFPENFVDERLFPQGGTFNLDNYGPIRVPKRGDIVTVSKENYYLWEKLICREGHMVGPGTDNQILIDGRQISSYTVEKNYLFALGDNFYNSYDSRFWGFLPEENVIGEASMVYWSLVPSGDEGRASGGASVRWNRIGKFIR